MVRCLTLVCRLQLCFVPALIKVFRLSQMYMVYKYIQSLIDDYELNVYETCAFLGALCQPLLGFFLNRIDTA